MATKSYNQLKNCITVDLMLTMMIETKILVLGKLSRTTVVSMATKSYDQLEFLNLVTMATNKIVEVLI